MERRKKNQEFQSTLPRGERRCKGERRGLYSRISIHAPARGATFDGCAEEIAEYISIHAPARGATLFVNTIKATLKFQSTLPRGERLYLIVISTTPFPISIHAPARGATLYIFFTFYTIKYFNPRSREGSDDVETGITHDYRKFQSTLPRGERLQFYLKFTLCF